MMEISIDKKGEGFTREFPRVSTTLDSDLRMLDPAKKFADRVPTQTRTLGGGGVMLVSPVPLKAGAKIETRLFYYSLVIEFTGKVVWSETVEKFGRQDHYAGVKFQEILPEYLGHIQNIIKSQQNPSH